MIPTDILRDEHRLITVMLDIMESLCLRLEANPDVNHDHLDLIIDFIRAFADRCHHAKEEKSLFPALEAAGVPRENGPIGVMLKEHALGRNLTSVMEEALAGMRAGDRAGTAMFIRASREYVSLLRSHIRKENNVLFTMAGEKLSPAEQKRVMDEFERIEREETGPGAHEKYHELLRSLRDQYLH
jgi:hemerythrin-like domain-containing protein